MRNAIDLIVPPIGAPLQYIAGLAQRMCIQALERVSADRDELARQNIHLRRLLIAVLEAHGGEAKITDCIVVELEDSTVIRTEYNGLDCETRVWTEKK